MKLRRQRLRRRLAQCARLVRACGFVLPKPETLQSAYKFARDGHVALVTHFGHKDLLLFEPPGKNACPPVHKALGQRIMQSVRQAVFYPACLITPMFFVRGPAPALRDIGPCADKRQSFGKCVDIAIAAVQSGHLCRHVAVRHLTALMQVMIDLREQQRVLCLADSAKVGDAADIPQKPHRNPVRGARADFGIIGQRLERGQIVAFAHAGQPVIVGPLFQRRDQPFDRSELQPAIAPLQPVHRAKLMVFNRFDHVIIQRMRLARDAKCALGHVATRAARDLGQLVGCQITHPRAVKLGQRGKRHMRDIKVQAHADGIGRHQIIDIAILIQFHLRIAGARAQRAHHDGRTALGPAQQLGDRIYIFNRKPDDGGPIWHAAYLFRTCVGQGRESLAPQELDMRHQCGNRATHGLGPQQQRLVQAPRMQQPMGKDMTTLGIGA